jgi:hypothetical protein
MRVGGGRPLDACERAHNARGSRRVGVQTRTRAVQGFAGEGLGSAERFVDQLLLLDGVHLRRS